MDVLCLEAPKAEIEDFRNEDAMAVRRIGEDALLAALSDGASTGVFSKEWSDHIVRHVEPEWLKSVDDFENGLKEMRASFKPSIVRQSALRKFLLQGSYATLLAMFIQKDRSRMDDELALTIYAVGDVCCFIFTEKGDVEFTFPCTTLEAFNNVPHLIRSSAKLQKNTPYDVLYKNLNTQADNLIVIATDALSEYLFKTMSEGRSFDILKDIIKCQDNNQFKELVTFYRQNDKMKNDDVSVCFITDRPDIYFIERNN